MRLTLIQLLIAIGAYVVTFGCIRLLLGQEWLIVIGTGVCAATFLSLVLRALSSSILTGAVVISIVALVTMLLGVRIFPQVKLTSPNSAILGAVGGLCGSAIWTLVYVRFPVRAHSGEKYREFGLRMLITLPLVGICLAALSGMVGPLGDIESHVVTLMMALIPTVLVAVPYFVVGYLRTRDTTDQ